MNWSLKEAQEVIKALHTDAENGLSSDEAQRRLLANGQNKLPEKPHEKWFFVFLRQFKSPLIYILLVAAVVIFFIGKDRLDALVVSGVLLFNAIVGTMQEGKAQNILEGLKRFVKATSVVLRDGKKFFIDDAQLVVGDIIFLQEGERVPADARIIHSNNIQIDEAILTGESSPVQKQAQVITSTTSIHDQQNMVFKGTYILSGSGMAVVVATGIATEIGQIHLAAEEIDTDMPLKKEISNLSYWILWFILGMCLFLFFVGVFKGKSIKELVPTLAALFICVIPEGLPVVLTLVLVSGVNMLARRNVLVKRMQGVEALGRADAIIIDKTGTLTRNEMVVSKIVAANHLFSVSGIGYFSQGQITYDGKSVTKNDYKELELLGIATGLLNSSEINFVPDMNLFDIKGNPTEISMAILSQKLGFTQSELEKEYQEIYEIPFDARLQYHAVFHKKNGKGEAFISGSPEKLMSIARNVSSKTKEYLSQMLQDGLRVVAIACKTFDMHNMPEDTGDEHGRQEWFEQLIAHDISFIGFCGIQDSIRPEVAETITQTRKAGIRIIMATGDHKKTALFVAKKVGIFADGDLAIDGIELQNYSDADLSKIIPKTTVFARVTPKQKLRIVKSLQNQGKIVAMTGDGVNDVPSLAAADLGIAMGRIGTEAAKQASDIVLLDDSFVSIMNAVEYGRHIFYTLRRVVLYFFSTNLGEVLVVFFALVLGMPLPLLAVQILWLNIVTDGFLDMAISVEKKEEGLLSKESREHLFHLVDWGTAFKMFFMAAPMAFFSLYIFCQYCGKDIMHARSITLVTMAMFQWFNAFNCRSENKSIFQIGLFSNRWLLLAMAVVFALQIFVLHNSFMQRLFKTTPISLSEWAMVILVASSILVLEEVRKWFVHWYKKRTS